MNDLVPINDLQTMAVAIAKSGLFGAKTADQALALMLVAQAEGLHPASAARDYDIIQGKGAKKSEAMLRDFLKAGGSVKWHSLDDAKADATFSHPAGGEVRIVWDMARAARAELSDKPMYKKFSRQMLRARCVSEGVRTVCPMATGGMDTPEEVQDIPEKDMGNAERVTHTEPKDTGPKPYPAADFEKNFTTWANLIVAGKKTAADIIKTVSSKAVLSDEQKKKIEAVKRADATVVTFEQVYAKLEKSDGPDVLDLAADFIKSVADEQQRADLTKYYHQRKEELTQ